MVNSVLIVSWIFFISIGSCIIENNVQENKNYTFILNVSTKNNKNYVDADYVQYFIGDKAIEEAKKNGEVDSRIVNGEKVYSIPGDFYILNVNTKIRKIEVSDDVKLYLIGSNSTKNGKEVNTFENFKKDYKDKLFLLTIKNKKIIVIEEVFTP